MLRIPIRFFATNVLKDTKFASRIQSVTDKSSCTVPMRIPSYSPPSDVKTRIEKLSTSILNIDSNDISMYRFQSNLEKFKLLTACASEFKHPIQNSYLHEIVRVSDLIAYYEIPVESPDTLSRLTQDNSENLPQNLCIQTDPVRYDPKDTSFFKQTAFPGRSTIVSGLATAKRYTGFHAPRTRRMRINSENKN